MMFWNEVHKIDQEVTLAINSWNSPITDPIWAFFSDKYVWIPMYAGILALIIWKLGWKKSLFAIGAIVLAFAAGDQISNVVKHAVERIRPVNDGVMQFMGLHVLETGGGYSFYSAHATNSFALAFTTFWSLKNPYIGQKMPNWLKIYGCWIFFWAFMVAASRIFVGKHYLGDVIVGSLVGCMIGLFFGHFASKLMCRNTQK